MPTPTVTILFPTAVRDRVLEQHQGLRALLQQTLDVTTVALRRDGPERAQVSRLVQELRARFFAHLAFEERTLAPVLAQVDLWGPERVQDLLAEHTRQRAEVDTLVAGLESHWDVERLALVLRSLATDLLIDMEEEERGCVSADLLRDEMIIVETMRE
jgi:hypothetical protein